MITMQRNILYNECCTKTMSCFNDKCIDLVITSPPYNMRTRIRNGEYTTRERTKNQFSHKYDYFSDAMPIDEFYEFHSMVLPQLLRISHIVCYNFQIVTGSKEAFFRMIGDFSRYIKDIIVWDKGVGQPAMHPKVMNSCYEFVLILESDNKAGRAIQNAKFERGTMNNIIRPSKRSKSTVASHSATFHPSIVSTLMKAFSTEYRDTVYDPFMGTGMVGVIATQLNRHWIGSEIVPEYCDIARTRIANARGLFSDGHINHNVNI